jgi:excisionase family DNA binding protein
MAYTLGEAAKAVGKSKATISKAIKNGRISAEKLENGAFKIEPAELHRVYPSQSVNTQTEQKQTLGEHEETAREIIRLTEKLKAVEQRVEDLTEDRNEWRNQATRLLGKVEDSDAKPGLLKRIFG